MMNRDEIMERMVKGAEYLERTDLSEVQREKAKRRYEELEQELKKLDDLEESRANTPENVKREMDKIREILKGANPRNRPA